MTAGELERMLRLPAAERVTLIGQIWDSLVDDGFVPELSPQQGDELDRRLDRLERDDPAAGVSSVER